MKPFKSPAISAKGITLLTDIAGLLNGFISYLVG